MSLWALAMTLAFVAAAMALSIWQRLGLEKDMVVAAVRATVQLLAIGYVLKFVFHVDHAALTAAMVLLMSVVAADNASRRGQGLAGRFWRVWVAVMATEIATQGFLLAARVIPPEPAYVIPISGMIIGNAMVASALFLNRLRGEAQARRDEMTVLLSLGATPRQASRAVVKAAVKASMIPTIDSTKTMGLVQLPGMMTGQIIAGADPIKAVRYQLLIVFALIASAAITTMVLGALTYGRLFNQHQQPVV
ncbi:ABC transporter permease [Alicyclobacillus macrosporangiidus]|uniref:Putative ABC transport system permease protein n=1 Tax=Alicyclobacillus macrosporangiidus TaxID=392015 RepID=A0A1I7H153_9BACL|nr:iron export ABC transporter permease subunit FetB [Alicyclobacillus macrosporangiidus]SFU54429.1 putative ABC transport system permease protein [Alicyclobacillus macrosporangiidus]